MAPRAQFSLPPPSVLLGGLRPQAHGMNLAKVLAIGGRALLMEGEAKMPVNASIPLYRRSLTLSLPLPSIPGLFQHNGSDPLVGSLLQMKQTGIAIPDGPVRPDGEPTGPQRVDKEADRPSASCFR
eukprot:1227052-Alexandrium_andersonii.AAC.1